MVEWVVFVVFVCGESVVVVVLFLLLDTSAVVWLLSDYYELGYLV